MILRGKAAQQSKTPSGHAKSEELEAIPIDNIDCGVADDDDVECPECRVVHLRGLVRCGACGKVQPDVQQPEQAQAATQAAHRFERPHRPPLEATS